MARLRSEQSRSFAAGMALKSATTYRPNEASLIQNGRVQPDGTIQPRGGTVRAHALPLNEVFSRTGYGGVEFIAASGRRQWIVCVGDSALVSEDRGATWTIVANETLTQNYWSFTTFRQSATNYLLAANGGNEIWEWDGETWSENTNYPDGVKYLATFNDRVYFAGHDGVTLGASKVGDRNTLAAPDGLTLQIATHDGDHEITGLFQIKDLLICFKRESTAYVDGYGNTDIIVATGPLGISRSVGCVAFRSIVGAGNQGVLWLSERGVEHWIPGGPIQLVSEPMRPFFEELNWSTIFAEPALPVGFYYRARHQYWLWLPSVVAQNERAYVYDLQLGAAALDTLPVTSDEYTVVIDADGYLAVQKDITGRKVRLNGGYLEVMEAGETGGTYVDMVPGSGLTTEEDYLALPSNNTAPAAIFTADRPDRPASPIGVGYDGFVRYMDEGEFDDVLFGEDEGEDIDFRVRTRPMLFGAPFHRKRGRVVDILATAEDAAGATVVLVADGTETSVKAFVVPAAAGAQPQRVKLRVNGRGRTLQVEFRSVERLNLDGIRLAAETLREVA